MLTVSERPTVRALVGFISAFGLASQPTLKTLEDAEDFASFGFCVMVDPFDLEALTRWEQIQRSLTTRARQWLQD